MTSDAKRGSAAQPPRWMPTGAESDLRPVGEWWDVIRTFEEVGHRAIDILEEAGCPVGPVFLHPTSLEPRLYFLVAVGASSNWNEPDTVALGRTCHVLVPPLAKTSPPGLHWHKLPNAPHVLTVREPLRQALTKARRER
ncbi:hypothetical protein [Streptomyces cucumeris]|uniref:hypothetical protein n=1 Tax=Streptomyces cucumeris TaxID=2962890 RepID=UPI0020C89412|nr:hypothetical protein [Streptomyces sp. NEAU-Y11]MCP9213117.1 hypothetical protein [Streptomyces sp. NEAU-Y11]